MKSVKIQKRFASNPNFLPEIERFFMETFKELDLPERKYNELILALSEASSNAIKHGNKSNPDKFIEIAIEITPELIDVKIKDEGKGFNPNEVPNPTEPENLLKESGRGLFIIKAFVDDFSYEFLPDGTVAHLVVYR